MDFLSSYWLILFIIAVVLYAFAAMQQVRNMKRIASLEALTDSGGFFKGMLPTVLCGLGGSAFLILAAIGVIANLMARYG